VQNETEPPAAKKAKISEESKKTTAKAAVTKHLTAAKSSFTSTRMCTKPVPTKPTASRPVPTKPALLQLEQHLTG